MKKILITLMVLFCGLFSMAQFPFTAPPLGAPNSKVPVRGGIAIDSTFYLTKSYTDTVAANVGFLDAIPGATIRVGDNYWVRNHAATKWNKISFSTDGDFIWNQYAVHQDANSWYDSSKLKRLSIANEDSAHFDWWWKGDNDPSWTYFTGKNLWVSDNDTVTTANDGWAYSINTNATFQRVTRLNPSLNVGYRFNLMANQVYTNGDTPATMGLLGGDVGASIYGKIMLKNNAGYNGRTVIQGGTPWFNATPTTVSIFEVDGFDPAHVYATGYWSGYNSILIAIAPDSVDHFIHYNTVLYTPGFNGNIKSETGFYMDYSTAPAIAAKWGIYAPDTSGNSYNHLSRLGVGDSGFGSHETPSFHSSAALQINGIDRGFITSRITAAQRLAIASPDTALFVWDTDSIRYMGYTGTGWRGVAWTGEGGAGGFFSPNQSSSGATTHDGNDNSFTVNDLGTVAFNVNADKEFSINSPVSEMLYLYNGSSGGSVSILKAKTTGVNQTVLELYSEGLDESENANFSVLGTNFQSQVYMDRDIGVKMLSVRNVGITSNIQIKSDSIWVRPHLGNFFVDTLDAEAGTKAIRYNTATGKVTYFDTTASLNIYNSNGTLTSNRELSGAGTMSLTLDSLDYLSVTRNSIIRMYMSSTMSSLYSPDGTNSIVVSNAGVKTWWNGGVNYFDVLGDSSITVKKVNYTANIRSTFDQFSHVDKGYVDSLAGTIGGGSPGGSTTQFQWNNAGSFDGSANFTQQTNQVRVTATSTSVTPFVVRNIAAQTVPAIIVQNSGGTGNFITLNQNGEALFASDVTATLQDPDAFDNTHQVYGGGNARFLVSSGSGYDHRLVAVTGDLSGVYTGFVNGGGVIMETNNALNLGTNKTVKAVITADGRLYGTALHNNAGAVTGTTTQYIASGTYTPTLTGTTNVAGSTAYACQWIRVGNVVTVSGKFDVDVTSAAATELNISLPIASAFTVDQDLGGAANSAAAASLSAAIRADATNDRAAVVFTAVSITNDSYFFTFTYLIK